MSVPRHIIDDIDFYIKCRDKRSDWAKKSQKWFNFCILNRQWTRNEKEQLKDRGHAPLVINRMKPATRLYKHYLGASSPTIKTIPLRMPDLADVTSEQMSKVYNTIFTHIWYNNSHGDQENAKVIEDMLVRGVGYWFIKHDKMINDGEGGIVIKSLDPLDVFIDPNSREPDLTDAEGIVISKKVSANLVRQLFPKKWQVIKKAINRYTDDSNLPATSEWSESGVHYYDEVYDEEVHEVRLFDVYRREVVKVYEIVNLKTGDYYELNEREYEKFAPKAKGILDYEKKEKRVFRIKQKLLVGDTEIFTQYLPSSFYPIIPSWYQHLRNPYPVSMVFDGIFLQREINKRRSLMIAHASSNAGSGKLIGTRGAFGAHKEEIEADLNRPNSVIEIDAGMDEIQILQSQPIPQALIALEAMAKEDMNIILGAPLPSMGFGEGHSTFRGLMAMDETSQRNVDPVAKNFRAGISLLGKVTIDYIQAYMTAPQMVNVTQPMNSITDTFEKLGINVPVYDDNTGVIKAIKNDVSKGRYNVIAVAGMDIERSQAAMLDMIYQFYVAGVIDDIEAWKHIPLFDKQGLILRKSIVVQLSQTVEEQQKNLDALMKELDNTQATLQDERMKHELTKFKKHMEHMKTRMLQSQNEIDTQMKRAVDALDIERQRVKLQTLRRGDEQKSE